MTSANRIQTIDQIRGLAAISVAWFHLTNSLSGWPQAAGAWGWLGVEAFFVISGFVVPFSLNFATSTYRLADYPHFLARRIIRLEPAYLVSIALVLFLNFLASMHPDFMGARADVSSGQVMAHLAYLVPLTPYDWLQPVYWTLAYEFAFYLAIGLVFPVVGQRGSHSAARIAATGVIATVWLGWTPVLLALFVMGFAVFRQSRSGEKRVVTMLVIGASTGAMISAGALPQALVGSATACILMFHSDIRLPAGWFNNLLRGLGAISYSLYLVHVPIGGKVVNFGLRFVGDEVGQLLLAVVALSVSIVAAVLLYALVEKPSILAARRFGYRMLKPATPTTS